MFNSLSHTHTQKLTNCPTVQLTSFVLTEQKNIYKAAKYNLCNVLTCEHGEVQRLTCALLEFQTALLLFNADGRMTGMSIL